MPNYQLKLRILLVTPNTEEARALCTWLQDDCPDLEISAWCLHQNLPLTKIDVERIVGDCHARRCQFVAIHDDLINHDRQSYQEIKQKFHPTVCVFLTDKTIDTSRATENYLAGIIPFHGRKNNREALARLAHLLHDRFDFMHGKWADMEDEPFFNEAIRLTRIDRTEALEVVNRLFRDDESIVWDSLQDTTLLQSVRTRSIVLQATVGSRLPVIVKIADKHRIDQEAIRYRDYIDGKLEGLRYARINIVDSLWQLGGIVYTFIGGSYHPEQNQSPRKPVPFSMSYRKAKKDKEIDDLNSALDNLFRHTWSHQYRYDVATYPPTAPHFDQYNDVWSKQYEVGKWDKKIEQYLACSLEHRTLYCHFGNILSHPLPNPVYWAWQNKQLGRNRFAQKAVTHGDMHGDNFFVDYHNECWLIDFERSGPGPILQDFVELETDIVTRLVDYDSEPIVQLYEFALLITEFASTDASISIKLPLGLTAEQSKALRVIGEIRALAHEMTNYRLPEQYLWGLLMNAVFVAEITHDKEQHRQRYINALVFGGVICKRLEQRQKKRSGKPSLEPETWQKIRGFDCQD